MKIILIPFKVFIAVVVAVLFFAYMFIKDVVKLIFMRVPTNFAFCFSCLVFAIALIVDRKSVRDNLKSFVGLIEEQAGRLAKGQNLRGEL